MSLAKALQAAAGNAAGEATYVDDVFSTYLYTGNSSTQTITNGIDLAGEGGMVWVKNRGAANSHRIFDTVRGSSNPSNFLDSASTNAQNTGSTDLITSFNSSGFNLGDGGVTVNSSSNTYASWTFRKAEKFFDVVTYTGDGVAGRTVAHNLGSVPGMVIVKSTSAAYNWMALHRSMSANDYIRLNSTSGAQAAADVWNSTAPTSTVFTVGTNINTNESGQTYVAYLFAHNAGGFGQSGSENVISCGSYTGNGSSLNVNLGYEPQWILVRRSSSSDNWRIFDNMRGVATNGVDANLFANLSNAELASDDRIDFNATGFTAKLINNETSETYIYIAIRRPMKPPSSGTEVFSPYNTTSISLADAGSMGNGVGATAMYNMGFVTDAIFQKNKSSATDWYEGSRLQGNKYLIPNLTSAEASSVGLFWDSNKAALSYSGTYGTYGFKRASGFFDVVCYTGTGVARTVAHNLTVAPELMIVKARSGADTWKVYVSYLTAAYALSLNETVQKELQGASLWNSTDPTSSVFSLGTGNASNANNNTFVAYLFASYPGVSKVGSYTGNGSSQTINCGFTSGARFVLIKATSTTGNWIVADSARGINGSTDPALYLNSTAAEVTGFDWIDADSSGFIVNETATIAANTNGVSYIFLAVS